MMYFIICIINIFGEVLEAMPLKCVTERQMRQSSIILNKVRRVFAGSVLHYKKSCDLKVINIFQNDSIKMIFKDFGDSVEFLAFPPAKDSVISAVFEDGSTTVLHQGLEIDSSEKTLNLSHSARFGEWREVAKYGLASSLFNCQFKFPLMEAVTVPFDQDQEFGFDVSISRDAKIMFASPYTFQLGVGDRIVLDDIPTKRVGYPCPPCSAFSDVRVFFQSRKLQTESGSSSNKKVHELEIYGRNNDKNFALKGKICVSVSDHIRKSIDLSEDGAIIALALVDQDKEIGNPERTGLWIIDTAVNSEFLSDCLKLTLEECKTAYAISDVRLNANGSVLVALVEYTSEAGEDDWSIRVFVRKGDNVFAESCYPKWAVKDGVKIMLSKLPAPRAIDLSSDGNTLAVSFTNFGGYGAVVVFNRVKDDWVPVDEALTHELRGSIDDGEFGVRMALSGDGQTVVVGACLLSNPRPVSGGIIVFRRNQHGRWLQDGPIILPDNAVGESQVGDALGIDANGETIVFSGAFDEDPRFEGGAAWVYQRQLVSSIE